MEQRRAELHLQTASALPHVVTCCQRPQTSLCEGLLLGRRFNRKFISLSYTAGIIVCACRKARLFRLEA
jgi:hypothetical protein